MPLGLLELAPAVPSLIGAVVALFEGESREERLEGGSLDDIRNQIALSLVHADWERATGRSILSLSDPERGAIEERLAPQVLLYERQVAALLVAAQEAGISLQSIGAELVRKIRDRDATPLRLEAAIAAARARAAPRSPALLGPAILPVVAVALVALAALSL